MSPSSRDLDPTAGLHAFAVAPFVFLLVGATMVVLSLWMLRSRRRVRASADDASARPHTRPVPG